MTAEKVATGEPELLDDLSSNVTYLMTIGNEGTERAEDVELTDDLDAVFGAGNFSVIGHSIESAPDSFGAAVNPGVIFCCSFSLLRQSIGLVPIEGACTQGVSKQGHCFDGLISRAITARSCLLASALGLVVLLSLLALVLCL